MHRKGAARGGAISLDSLLEVAIRHRVGPLALDVHFETTAPWTVLFGASGSGKTTVMRCTQGWVQPEEGRISFRGVKVVDTATSLSIPPHLRAIRSAGQVARLFPATVLSNVCYGSQWFSKPMDTEDVAMRILDLLAIGHLADQRASGLSGGERQRVSVARSVLAAITSGSLLLLDEPFTGLDYPLRDQIALTLMDFLAQWKVPVLSVTHDVGEAFLLRAKVVRIAEGRVMAQGRVEEVLAADRERLLGQLGSAGGNPP